MPDTVNLSAGIYFKERDLSFVTRQVGVTTLGLVGETTIGPAFQPIFINNYGTFTSLFGGQNATKVKDTGAPQYELPYIAKSYLSQSNQLFVTRVLGLSGFDAGLSWGITLSAAVNPATTGSTYTATFPAPYITFSGTPQGNNMSYSSSDSLTQSLINSGQLNLSFIQSSIIANTPLSGTTGTAFKKTGSSFSGLSSTQQVIQVNLAHTGVITGTTSGVTTYYSGTSYSNIDNRVVALLRSRGKFDGNQNLNFEVTGSTGLIFDPSVSGATTSPLASFAISGVSTTQGAFDYNVSLDKTKTNYLPRVLGRTAQDGNTALFVEEIYNNMFTNYLNDGKLQGINITSLTNYSRTFDNYKEQYQSAITPYVVSEVRGNKVLKLFRLHTISDGNAANEQFKISITNISPDNKTFNVIVRSFYDTDASPTVLESFSNCTMDPTSNNYIARKIGTLDGVYASKSMYMLAELDDTADTSDAFPAGFLGIPIRDYKQNSNTTIQAPTLSYKTAYGTFENKRKFFLGLNDTVGIDADFLDYKGVPNITGLAAWTGMTQGFHMDIQASGVTIANGGTSIPYTFDCGVAEFKTDAGIANGPYEKLYARKFTFAPYGGFDGWDVYRTRRTNQDSYAINGTNGAAGLANDTFQNRSLTNGDLGINSDYYAFLEAIWTFKNPEAVNINVFATPGIDTIDNTNLVESAIEMIEIDRADSIYIVTTPDTDAGGDIKSVEDVADDIDSQFDSNYTATYWPWIQINDVENNVYIYIPPTREVIKNIALTDNIAFPWYASAGFQRGGVDCIQPRVKLTQNQRDILYSARINPLEFYSTDGTKIMGNKNLQIKDSALNRINVRRLLLQARKLIAAVGIRLLFEPNDSVVRNQFLSLVNPILDNIRTERGLDDFRVEVSDSPEDRDRNELNGTIYIVPTKSLERINVEFVITSSSASFTNV